MDTHELRRAKALLAADEARRRRDLEWDRGIREGDTSPHFRTQMRRLQADVTAADKEVRDVLAADPDAAFETGLLEIAAVLGPGVSFSITNLEDLGIGTRADRVRWRTRFETDPRVHAYMHGNLRRYVLVNPEGS